MSHKKHKNDHNNPIPTEQAPGANIAGVPIDEPPLCGQQPIPANDGSEAYIPRHLDTADRAVSSGQGDYIDQPDGSHIAPNGAVINDPWSEQPEIKPEHEYTPEKEDLDLLIM